MPLLRTAGELSKHPFSYIDAGCGPQAERARWLASKHPEAQVLAVDAQRLKPGMTGQLPKNVHFIQMDLNGVLPKLREGSVSEIYADHLQAYVHADMVGEVKRVLESGGKVHINSNGTDAHILHEMYKAAGFHTAAPRPVTPESLGHNPSYWSRRVVLGTEDMLRKAGSGKLDGDPFLMAAASNLNTHFAVLLSQLEQGKLPPNTRKPIEDMQAHIAGFLRTGRFRPEILQGLLVHEMEARKKG